MAKDVAMPEVTRLPNRRLFPLFDFDDIQIFLSWEADFCPLSDQSFNDKVSNGRLLFLCGLFERWLSLILMLALC